MRIAVIEDNEALAQGIAYRLQDAGHAVDMLHDGLAARDHLASEDADLIILDITLPRLDGLSLLHELRLAGDKRPVLLLTARAETVDRVAGLDAGADDYLVKPFEMAEFEARVRALLRRRDAPLNITQRIGNLVYDPAARQLRHGNEPLDLTRREAALFACLLDAEGRPVPKSRLLDQIYGTGADVDDSVIEVHVSRLRKRLAQTDVSIRTLRGFGYLLEAGG